MEPLEAQPRTSEEIAQLPDCPEVLDEARRIGVDDVVHFTTTRGAVGILYARALKSRKRLRQDQYLEYVYRPNADTRKDAEWLDYANLSVQRINDWMFDRSTRWHATEDISWMVLSFTPRILAHPGVVFTTTNNIYPACRRAEGLEGFSRMFADQVCGRYSELHNRVGKQSSWPTDRQAEVLYPGELSCDHLQRIDVQLEETLDRIRGALGGLNLDVPVRHAPEVFE